MTDGFTAKETDVEAVSTSVPETTNHLIEVIEIVNFLLQGINPAQKDLPHPSGPPPIFIEPNTHRSLAAKTDIAPLQRNRINRQFTHDKGPSQ
ncbi:hypothetical protein [Slackia sp.]|uniref:hypothetical protein n=1 Tax=Slackia sp. TaxID=2049041 RepID=UPI0026104E24|nr:hypothetical protein [Slackia sp.]